MEKRTEPKLTAPFPQRCRHRSKSLPTDGPSVVIIASRKLMRRIDVAIGTGPRHLRRLGRGEALERRMVRHKRGHHLSGLGSATGALDRQAIADLSAEISSDRNPAAEHIVGLVGPPA